MLANLSGGGGANLLAGRAYVNNLYPLTFAELGSDFKLDEIMRWGSLPKLYQLDDPIEKEEFLKAYVNTYLKEEVLQEQLVRNAVPFRKFLPVTAQMNGKILKLFEQFIILELHRLNDYYRLDYQFSFICTQGGLEIDLLVERPGRPSVLVEIKSSSDVKQTQLRHILELQKDFPEFEAVCICREKKTRKIGNVLIMGWMEAFRELGICD